MNKPVLSFIFAFLLVGSASAVAAPNVVVGTDSIIPGGAATIAMSFDADGTVASFDFRYTFDDAQFTATPSCVGSLDTTGTANATVACSVVGNEVRVFVSAAAEFPVPPITAGSVSLGSVSFQSLGGTPVANYPLAVTQENYFNSSGSGVTPTASTNGNIEVTAGPQPTFSSAPPPGAINLGPVAQGASAPTQNIVISNTGAAGSDLDGTCSFTAGDTGVITLTSDGVFTNLQVGGGTDTQTVSCDTAVGSAVPYSATLTCPHDGTNGPNAVYTVNCTVDLPPAPEYGSNPGPGGTLSMGPVEQGDPNPTAQLLITNTGDAGSFLDSNCTESNDPNNKFTITNGVNNAIPATVSAAVTVSCDASAQGMWAGQMSCVHTGETVTSPALYDLSCEISPPGAAVFGSNPVNNSIIDLTPEGAVPEGASVTPLPLTFFNNADVGDSDLAIGCSLTGDPEITINPTTVLDGYPLIAPTNSLMQSFSCDTAAAGVYQAFLSCDYFTDGIVPMGEGSGGSADYTIDCEVRLPQTEVVPSPGDGATLQTTVDIGGTGTVGTVRFQEVLDENLVPNNAAIESCTIGGTDAGAFAISAPGSFPQEITSGGFVDVVVQGTDINPGQQLYNGTMDCFYSDSNGDLPFEASYQLVLNVEAGDATFLVTKEFTDGNNPTLVDVTLSCFTGLPLIQTQTISETQDVNFIVQSFESGELDCSVTEDLDTPELLGYTPTYVSGGDSSSDNDGGCNFYNVEGGDENTCNIINDADPVDVVIEKDWIIEGIGGDSVDQNYKITVYCNAPIVNEYAGKPPLGCGPIMPLKGGDPDLVYLPYCQEFNGYGDDTFVVQVIPQWPSSQCVAYETVYTSGVEIFNECDNLTVSHGQGDSCLITNTVFFEGIPTLSQYGMAILVLLMLGVGLVGFRRFT